MEYQKSQVRPKNDDYDDFDEDIWDEDIGTDQNKDHSKYSGLSNNRAGCNKHAGCKNSSIFEKLNNFFVFRMNLRCF